MRAPLPVASAAQSKRPFALPLLLLGLFGFCASDPHFHPDAALPDFDGETTIADALKAEQPVLALQLLEIERRRGHVGVASHGANAVQSIESGLSRRGMALGVGRDFLEEVQELQRPIDSISLLGAEADLRQVQQSMPADFAAIIYMVVNDRYSAFVVSRYAIVYVDLGIPRALLNSLVLRARQLMQKPGPGDAPGSRRLERALAELYGLVFAPLERHLPGRRLALIPSSELQTIPFQALVRRGRSIDGPPEYLIDRYEISYAISLGRLIHSLQGASASLFRMMIIGDPYHSQLSTALLPLPAARAEALLIQAALPEANVRIGPAATESYFMESAGNHSVLHLATHGMAIVDNPAASFLLLADDASEDGVLTLAEVGASKLNADLVVLSACETGAAIGAPPDNNSALSLATAFQAAGARAVISSLWPVADASTGMLMVSFYSRYGDQGIASILRSAQLELKSNERYSHPFFWAPFILTGSYQ